MHFVFCLKKINYYRSFAFIVKSKELRLRKDILFKTRMLVYISMNRSPTSQNVTNGFRHQHSLMMNPLVKNELSYHYLL